MLTYRNDWAQLRVLSSNRNPVFGYYGPVILYACSGTKLSLELIQERIDVPSQ